MSKRKTPEPAVSRQHKVGAWESQEARTIQVAVAYESSEPITLMLSVEHESSEPINITIPMLEDKIRQ
jgi:hypothetical protein